MPADRPDSATVEATILRLVEGAAGKTVSPAEVAHALAAGENWQSLLGSIRRAAVKLALAGAIAIYRKGKPVDPSDFKGVYRLGPGNSAEVRPVSQ